VTLGIAVHNTQSLTNLPVAKRSKPPASVYRLNRQPSTNCVNENQIGQPSNHELGTGMTISRFKDKLAQCAIEPAVPLFASSRNLHEPRQQSEQRILDSIVELENSTD